MSTAVLLHTLRRPLPRALSTAIEKATGAIDTCELIAFREHYAAGSPPKVWFDVPNYGNPFDSRMARQISDELEAAPYRGTNLLAALKAAAI